ncbi:putative Proteasome maturation protein [Hypsibius exemplaris]|uniref:Proteasome maturation protein n=1 Tax=Hypsibius exemplaris TaxID=2072580 RepID=A0A1W0WEN7_HYPEX|nr:putative Proteasome maturation protein [Hypsibius exemplaris]
MSFGYPPLQAGNHKAVTKFNERSIQTEVNPHGLRDALQDGLTAVAKKSADVHPLEISQSLHRSNEEQIKYAMLRSTQGIHAPLRLQMEKFLVEQPTRFSVFPPSHLHLDVLNGRDETIDFEDVLNVPEYWERSVNPHVYLEKKADRL